MTRSGLMRVVPDLANKTQMRNGLLVHGACVAIIDSSHGCVAAPGVEEILIGASGDFGHRVVS